MATPTAEQLAGAECYAVDGVVVSIGPRADTCIAWSGTSWWTFDPERARERGKRITGQGLLDFLKAEQLGW